MEAMMHRMIGVERTTRRLAITIEISSSPEPVGEDSVFRSQPFYTHHLGGQDHDCILLCFHSPSESNLGFRPIWRDGSVEEKANSPLALVSATWSVCKWSDSRRCITARTPRYNHELSRRYQSFQRKIWTTPRSLKLQELTLRFLT